MLCYVMFMLTLSSFGKAENLYIPKVEHKAHADDAFETISAWYRLALNKICAENSWKVSVEWHTTYFVFLPVRKFPTQIGLDGIKTAAEILINGHL